MKLCLDASVAAKWVLPEPDSSRALALRDDFRNGSHELIAPDILPLEVGHALTRAERKGILQVGEAMTRLAEIATLPLDLHSFLPLLPDAVQLSSSERIGLYDAIYIALSMREKCPLVTADQRLVTLFPMHVISLASM